ncbi:MAG TPA: Sua5 family C-terminal domain-containing protein, partial [Terrimicrobiaceae bacterium]
DLRKGAAALLGAQKNNFPKKTGFLLWLKPVGTGEREFVEYLSPTQDLREAAASLYGALRRLDQAGLDLIVAEAVPEIGLGVAIMERLRKAAARE